MEEINITYDECFLEPLTKRILLNLVREMSKYINKNLLLDEFYDKHPTLYKTAKDKRTPKFKRKRILIITSSPLNFGIVEEAINNINEKYKIKALVCTGDLINPLLIGFFSKDLTKSDHFMR